MVRGKDIIGGNWNPSSVCDLASTVEKRKEYSLSMEALNVRSQKSK